MSNNKNYNNKIILGIDIGTTKICAIVGSMDDQNNLDILGVGVAESLGVLRGMVINIDKTTLSVEKAVNTALKQADVDIDEAVIGIAGQHINSFMNSTSITKEEHSEVKEADIKKLISDVHKMLIPNGDVIIHVMPQEYLIDDRLSVKDPIGVGASKIAGDFHVITACSKDINNIVKSVKNANITCKDLILESIASSCSVLTDEEKEAGVCLVDIGGGTSDIAIFKDGILRHSAVIPLGGKIITQDIKEGCNLMEMQAEKIKIACGIALEEELKENKVIVIPGVKGRDPKEITNRNLARIMEVRLVEIFERIDEEVIKSKLDKKLTCGIVLTGGGSNIKEICKLSSMVTGLETKIGYPNEYLGRCIEEKVKNPIFATSIGLVLAGFLSNDPKNVDNKNFNSQKKTSNSGSKGGFNDFFRNLTQGFRNLLLDNID